MKKITFLLLIILNLPLFSNDINFDYDFTIAYLPLETMFQHLDTSLELYKDDLLCFYTDFKAKITFLNLIFIGGNIRCNFFKSVFNYDFTPNMMSFQFSTGICFNDNIEIGFNHFCTHPILPYLKTYANVNILFEGAYEEIYIKFSGTTKK